MDFSIGVAVLVMPDNFGKVRIGDSGLCWVFDFIEGHIGFWSIQANEKTGPQLRSANILTRSKCFLEEYPQDNLP